MRTLSGEIEAVPELEVVVPVLVVPVLVVPEGAMPEPVALRFMSPMYRIQRRR